MSNTRVVLFGGGGFVGSHLSHALAKSGKYEVLTTDIDQAKLKLRFGNQAYSYRDCDIEKTEGDIDHLVANADVVFHLAARVQPKRFLAEPLEVVKLNFFDALKVVDACVRHKTRLIHFSTSEVYGKTGGADAPFKEDESDCILGPIANHRWIYSSAKQLLDRLIHAHGLKGELSYTLVRPFNFAGPLMDRLIAPGSDDNPRVLAHFASALIFGRPLQLVNGGTSRRCFTAIDDAIAALEVVLENPGPLHNQIVNIGNPDNETSIKALAELMLRLYQENLDPSAASPIITVAGEVFYGPGYEDCDRRLPDISKLAALGWKPRKNLEDTFLSALTYFHENRELLLANLGDQKEAP